MTGKNKNRHCSDSDNSSDGTAKKQIVYYSGDYFK